MKSKLLFLSIALAFVGQASATFTVDMGSTGFLGESGQTSGITWGIVVDIAGDGFDAYSGGFTLADGNILGGSNDDTLYLGDLTTIALGPGGLITTNSNNPAGAASKTFAVIWFESSLSSGSTALAGDLYGFSTSITPTTITPADGGTGTYAVTGGGNAAIAFIPEPSTAVLAALGSLALLVRRRRST